MDLKQGSQILYISLPSSAKQREMTANFSHLHLELTPSFHAYESLWGIEYIQTKANFACKILHFFIRHRPQRSELQKRQKTGRDKTGSSIKAKLLVFTLLSSILLCWVQIKLLLLLFRTHRVRQTAKITFDFLFFSCNP